MTRISAAIAWITLLLAAPDLHAAGILRPIERTAGLAGARAVVASPDAQHLYVASTSGGVGAITVFFRWPDGTLDALGEIRDGVGFVTGLANVRGLAFLPDGTLYFGSPVAGALSIYVRNPFSGSIAGGLYTEGISGAVAAAAATSGATHYYVVSEAGVLFAIDEFGEVVQVLSDGVGGVDGLAGAKAVAVTPDGSFVYAYGAADGAVAGFARAGDGSLAPLAGSPFDASATGGSAPTRTNATLAVSPDGRFLALLCSICSSVATWSIDPASGALELTGAASSLGTTDVAFSADGRRMILAGGGSVAVFDRDPVTGDIELRDGLFGGVDFVTGVAGVCDVESVGFFGDRFYVASAGAGSITAFDVAAIRHLGRLQDGESPVTGLAQAASAVVSPDGRHVYAGGAGEDAVGILERDATVGLLTWLGEIRQGVAGAQGLDGADAAAMSPDGEHLFVLGGVGNSVASYGRDATTGGLTFESVLSSASSLAGLSGPFDADVSADGKHLYVAGLIDGGVWVLGYESVSGALSFVQQAADAFGLTSATAVAVSPDGAHVYASGRRFTTGAIAVFARSAATGALTRTGLLEEAVGGVTGLEDGPTGIAVSPDGRFVYAAGGSGDGALTIFARDGATGALAQTGTLRDGASPDCLGGVRDVAVSPDGDFVYTIATGDASVCLFARDEATGALTQIDAAFEGVGGVDGLAGAAAIAIAADGRNAYVAGSTDGTLAELQTPLTTAPEPAAALLGAAALASVAGAARRRRDGARDGLGVSTSPHGPR